MDYGFFIREQAIKNLLSAQRKMAAKGNAKGLIAVTKFILSISHQFDGEMLKISQGINIDGKIHVRSLFSTYSVAGTPSNPCIFSSSSQISFPFWVNHRTFSASDTLPCKTSFESMYSRTKYRSLLSSFCLVSA